jgi:hypothetical protein
MAELEAVKGYANQRERGVISDPRRINEVARLLAAHATNIPEVVKDEANQQTKLRSKGEVLMSVVKLEHH